VYSSVVSGLKRHLSETKDCLASKGSIVSMFQSTFSSVQSTFKRLLKFDLQDSIFVCSEVWVRSPCVYYTTK
jgi:hypothetical protein